MLFIYWLENHPVHAPRVKLIFDKMQERGEPIYTSVLTLGEVMVGPVKAKKPDAVRLVKEFLSGPLVKLLPVDADVAEQYAAIRADGKVAPADAIHLACAARVGINLFLTNDHRLQSLVVPGIDFIAAMDVGLF